MSRQKLVLLVQDDLSAHTSLSIYWTPSYCTGDAENGRHGSTSMDVHLLQLILYCAK